MNKFYPILLSTLLFYSMQAIGQETSCGNGIDDDGDGYVDCFDSDCSDSVECDDFFMGDEASCEALPTESPTFSMKLAGVSDDRTAATLSRISVGDLDSDGIPEIVVTNRLDKTMHILSGQADAPAVAGNPGRLETIQRFDLGYEVESDVAIGDIDRDGRAEIFVSGRNTTIEAYRYSTTSNQYEVFWDANTNGRGRPVVLGLADFNEDGQVELYYKDEIRDAETGNLLVTGSGDWERNITFAPVAVDILPDGACADCQGLELISGGEIFSMNVASGTRTKVEEIPNYYIKLFYGENWSSTSVADYNLDGHLDVIASGAIGGRYGATTVFFWDVQNDTVTTYSPPNNWERGTGRLNIADIDGDGNLNVTFVSGNKLFALDHKFNLLWEKGISEVTSAFTGTSVFDFNGDGAYEVVYRDETQLFIINGKDGNTYNQTVIPCISRTSSEYPIVVDVDGDGATEICVTCKTQDGTDNDWNSNKFGQVRVFKSDGENWVPSRKVWNQHTYFNVNVKDDLTIPQEMQKHHIPFGSGDCAGGNGVNRPLNTFLNQSPYLNINGCPTYGAPDFQIVDGSLEIHHPTCPGEDFTVSFQVRNDGDIPVSGDVPVTFYEGSPLVAGSTRLNTEISKVRNLKPDSVMAVDSMPVTGSGAGFTLYVSFNDRGTKDPVVEFPNGTILECEYGGNLANAEVEPLPFPIETLVLKDHVSCEVGEETPGNGAARAFVLEGSDTITAGYTFYWYDAADMSTPIDTGAIATTLSAGTFAVQAVHDEALCGSTPEEVIIQEGYVEYQLGIEVVDGNSQCKNPQAPGMYDGALRAYIYEVNAAGDTLRINDPAFSFKWYPTQSAWLLDPGSVIATTALAENLESTTYYVYFEDNSNGCFMLNSETVPDYTSQLTVQTESIRHITRCDKPNAGRIEASASGTANYKLHWYDSDTLKIKQGTSISGLAAGTYYVQAEENGTKCLSDLLQVLIEDRTALPQFNAGLTHNTACDNSLANGSITLAPSTPSPGSEPAGNYEVAWYNGSVAGGTSFASGYQVQSLASGTYTARLTNPDSRCFRDTTLTIETQLTKPELFLSGSDANTVCREANGITYDGSLQLTLEMNGVEMSGDTLKYFDIDWFDPSGTEIAGEDGLLLEDVVHGTYGASVTHLPTGCAIASKESFTIAEDTERPTVALTPIHATSCGGTPNGKAKATVSLGGNVLNEADYTIRWYDGADVLLPASQLKDTTAINLAPGSYKAIVSLKASNCSATAGVTVEDKSEIPVLKELSKSNNSVCDPGLTNPAPGTYNGAISLSLSFKGNPVSLPNADYSISWYLDGSSTPLSYTGLSTNDLKGGTYKIVVENTNLHCKDELEVTILDKKLVVEPRITAVNQTSCDATAPDGKLSVQMKDAAGTDVDNSNYRFSWTDENGVEVSSSSQAGNLSAGTYSVTAISNLTGCTYTNSKLLIDQKVIPEVTLSATQITDCQNQGQIQASVNVGTTGDYVFEWYDANGNQLSETGPTLTSWAGTFSVIAEHATTKCRSVEKEETINAPAAGNFFTIDYDIQTQAASCAVEEGKLKAWVDNGGIQDTLNYSFTWYPGRADNHPATYYTSPQAAFTQAAITNTSLTGATAYMLKAGIYTVVAEHKLTKCKEIKEVYLPYVNAHKVELVSKTDEDECEPATPNGSFHVRIDPSTIPAHPNPSLDYNQTDYHFYIYEGTDNSGNLVEDGLGKEALGANPAGYVVNNLKPGFYTVEAKEMISGSECIFASLIVEIKQLAKAPLIDLQTITPNTLCVNSSGFASGGIDFTFGPAAGDTETTDYNYEVFLEDGTTPATDENGNTLNGGPLAANSPVNLSGMLHGKYVLSITANATNCVKELPFEIAHEPIVPELLLQDITVTPQTYCSPENGKIEINKLTFGTETFDPANYTFSWTFEGAAVGTSSPVLADIAAGTYRVEVERIKNGAGKHCSITKDITVDYMPNTWGFTLVELQHSNACDPAPNNGILEVSASINGGALSAGSTYTWYEGNVVGNTAGLPVHASGSRIEDQAPGWYTLKVSDATTGCTYAESYEILDRPQNPEVVSLDVNNQTYCKDNGSLKVTEIRFDNTLITPTDAAWADYTFSWFDPSGNLIPGENSFEIENVGEGQYAVQVQKTNAPGQSCASPRKYAYVDWENPQLKLSLIATPNNSCDAANYNGSITASVKYENDANISTTGFDFTWTGSLSANSTSQDAYAFTGEAPGTYVISVVDDETGCTISGTITIEDEPQEVYVTDVLSLPQDICNPSGSLEVTGVNLNDGLGNYTFSWYSEDYDESNPAASFLATGTLLDVNNYPAMGAGTYYVVAVRGNFQPGAGCPSPARRVVVEDTSTPPAISLLSREHVTSCATANGALEVEASWRNTAGTYNWWYTPDSLQGNYSLYASNANAVHGLAAGFYKVIVEDLETGCENTRTFQIEDRQVIPTIQASATDLTYCSADNGTLFARLQGFEDASRSFEFHWYSGHHDSRPNGVNSQAGSGQALDNMPAGLYTVFAVEIGGMGCTASAQVEINDATQLPKPTATMEASVSNCDPLRPNGQASVHVGGNVTDYHFRWYSGTEVNESNFISAEVIATKLAPGRYTVQATHKISGCADTARVEVTEVLETITLADADVLLRHRTNCQVGNGSLSASVNGEIEGYEFFWFHGTAVNPNQQIQESGPVISGLEAGAYTVYARKTASGCISNPVTKTVEEQLVYPDITIETTAATCGEENGSATLKVLEGNIASVEWYTGTEVIRGMYSLTLPAGNYSVSVTTFDGCVTTRNFSVPVDIKVFNGITDNNDGENDFFQIDCLEQFPNNNVKIFNRAGTLVYETDFYNNADNIFDGIGNKGMYLQGNKLPAGTYFYVIDKRDGSKTHSGYLELIR